MKALMNIVVMLVIATTCQAREVLKEITQNTRLNGNIVYYVDNPPLLIHGSIEVIIPSGTTIVIKEDFDVPAIRIYDQAMVWFGLSRGITGQFDFPQQNDSNSLVRPVNIIGESGLPFNNNYCGILVERTASSQCLFDDIILQGFNYGMIIDKPLDTSISNVYIIDCWNGIQSYGSNKIQNSYVSNYGLDPDPDYTGYAYEFFANSRDGSVVYDNAKYILERCLADDGGYAFNGDGIDNPDTYPVLMAYDCASTNNYSGFNLWNGYISYLFLCPGIYNNSQDKNYEGIVFDYPAYDSRNPLVKIPSDHRIFLDPNSNFVDGGSSVISESGWTTRSDGRPDDGWGDIWPSYQTKSWSGLKSDLNSDGIVDVNDLSLLVGSWLLADESKKADLKDPIDLNGDGICNFVDFSILASEWLMEDTKVGIINLNNPDSFIPAEGQTVNGNIGICIFNPPPSMVRFTVYVDNTIVGTYSADVNTSKNWITIPTALFCNGWHDIKVSTLDNLEKNVNHKPVKLFFDNLISNVYTTEFFSPDSSKNFLGFNEGNVPLNVEVSSNGSVLWSQIVTGDSINLQIPGSVFASQIFADISIKPEGSLMASEIGTASSKNGYRAAASSSSASYDTAISREFNYLDYPDIRVIILLPDSRVTGKFMPAIYAWLNCFVQRGIPLSRIAVLSGFNVTEENIRLALAKPSRKYILYFGHGNSYVGPVQRSFIQAWKIDRDSHAHGLFINPFRECFAFSYTQGVVPLPDNWDNEGINLSWLNLSNSNKVEQMWMFGCKLGQFNDMAITFGMYSDWNAGNYDQIYGGFNVDVLGESIGSVDTLIKGCVNGSVTMAETLGQHRSVWDAFWAIQGNGNSNTVYWGLNGLIDIDKPDNENDDHFRIYGSWNMAGIRIEP
jgi:hypothetical protein